MGNHKKRIMLFTYEEADPTLASVESKSPSNTNDTKIISSTMIHAYLVCRGGSRGRVQGVQTLSPEMKLSFLYSLFT